MNTSTIVSAGAYNKQGSFWSKQSLIIGLAVGAVVIGISLGMPARASAASFYVAANGSDSNNGTSKTSPWAHLPGMPSCVSNCASYTPVAGDRFIFRGGDTWGASSLGINWVWSGNSGARIYIGVDRTWFGGASWARPIFNCQNSACGSTQYGNVIWLAGSYTTIDNIEFTGYQQSSSENLVAAYGNSNEVENFYFHGWSRTAGSGSFNSFAFTNNTSDGGGVGTLFHDNVIDGQDDPNKDFMGGVLHGDQVYHNVIRYVYNNNGGFNNVYGNLIENNYISVSGDHCNMFFFQGIANGSAGYFHNNVVRHTGCGSTLYMLSNSSCTTCTGYVYNNVFYDTDVSPEAITLGGHVPTGTYYVYNNTVSANHCMGNGDSGGGDSSKSTTHYANNHCITSGLMCDSTGTTCVDDGTNLQQTAAQADANTSTHFDQYTASELYAYSPVASSNSTVMSGTSHTAMCSGTLADLCSDTTYATYDTVNHKVVMRTAIARPASGAWDIGAYEYTSGTGDTTPPSVPTGLSATAISSSQINLSWTASTDNVGVTGYKVMRNGTQVGTSATNSYSDTGLAPSTTYTYTVSAYDAAGNNSSQSTSASATTQAGTTVSVSISPTSATVTSGGTQQFTATVSGSTNTAVTWTTSAGSISTSGFLTAPTVSVSTIITVVATSAADTTQSASAPVTVNPVTTGGTNVAPQGTAYRWHTNTTATADTNKVAETGLNDNDLTTDVNLDGGSAESSAVYEAGGVVWSTSQTINTVKFINGTWVSTGDGSFDANLTLQFTTDGTTWTNSGWAVSPGYPYDSATVTGATYTFSGTAVSVKGVRVSGQVHTTTNGSYWENMREVQAFTSWTVAPPAITSSLTSNATVGTSYSYQITATNGPTSYGASGLPSGLSVNTATGLISGTPTVSGTFTVALSATNSGGTGSATLSLTVSPAITDTTPPSKPANLSALPVSRSQVNVSWSASTDNVGVVGYNVFRNGFLAASSISTLSFNDTGLTPHTTYTYNVSALDAAGNESVQSTSTVATTWMFTVGDVVKSTTNGLNVRSSPTTSASILGTENKNAQGTILGGPAVADGYTWWQINWKNGLSGWSIQNSLRYVSGL